MVANKHGPTNTAVAEAIQLLTDAGYVVLRAPSWPVELATKPQQVSQTETQRASSVESERASSAHIQRELMTIKEFCVRYSISRSVAYVEINAGRLQIQKIGASTRISERAATEWRNAMNSRRRS
jgi:hypothetical protein